MPESFVTAPFAVGAALDAGIGEGRLRGPDLRRPFHGVRAAGTGASHPALELLPRLRDGDRFSAVTALALLGAPLPRRFEHQVHVTAGAGLERTRRRGVRGHDDDGQPLAWWGGAPISSPERAFVEAARLLSFEALVAVGDWLTLDPRYPERGRPVSSVDALLGAAAVRRQGVRFARRAIAEVRPGVESPAETRLRLLLVGSGLPEPVCGYPLHDRRGRLIGWFDLAWPAHRVLGEYDGDQHRTSREQYEHDIRRFDLAADEEWRVLRVRAHGLGAGAPDTIHRFRRALATSSPPSFRQNPLLPSPRSSGF